MKKKRKKNQPSLKVLISLWDRKLKEKGFQDIEDRGTGLLKRWAGTTSIKDEYDSRTFRSESGYSSITWKESQETYYRIASQFLHEKDFKNQKLRRIWELHSKGLSFSKISKEIRLTVPQVKYAISKMQRQFSLSQTNITEATRKRPNEPRPIETRNSNKKCGIGRS